MSVYLPYPTKSLLPSDHDVNTSLLMTKYGNVKTECEKEMSAEHVQRAISGKSIPNQHALSELPGTLSIAMKLEDRLIIDSAGGTSEHAGLCIHPHFGIPMIPGSAVKGAARHYLWEQWCETEEESEKQKLAIELAEIFGFPTGDTTLDEYLGNRDPSAGKITFFAAFPYGSAPLEVDVLTCHHPDYYSQKKDHPRKATDDEDPIPVFFPVVKKGATFEFVVRPLPRGDSALAERALELLTSALKTNGIGAKTAAGYGWFSEDIALKKKQQDEKLGSQVELYLQENLNLKTRLLEEGDFSTVVGRVLASGTDDEKLLLVALLKTEKSNYLKKQNQLARKGKAGPKNRVEAIDALMDELEELFE